MKLLLTFLATAAISSAATATGSDTVAPADAKPSSTAPKAPTLAVGSTVTPDALSKGEWIQGEAPKSWEPGKVYILECWATWCGPCVAAIPHVNGLYQKYADKGLRVCGMNVWERTGKEPVVSFVKGKGDGMSYPVSYNAKGGAFDTEWMVPAGVNGIPHAFVVKDGKIVMMTHPAQLSEEIIEALLAGGDVQEKAIGDINKKQAQQAQLGGIMRAFQSAAAKKDTAGMEKAIADLKAIDSASPYLATLDLQLLVAQENWAGTEAALEKLPDGPNQTMALLTIARAGNTTANFPVALMKSVTDKLAPTFTASGNAMQLQMLASFQWHADEKDAAIATAKKAVEAAGSEDARKMHLTVAPFERYEQSLEKGTLPDDKEFYGWLRESMSGAGAGKTEK